MSRLGLRFCISNKLPVEVNLCRHFMSIILLFVHPLLEVYNSLALAGVAQWIECWPVNQRVASSIPSQGICLDCGPGPQ